jgi:hypothetical protein
MLLRNQKVYDYVYNLNLSWVSSVQVYIITISHKSICDFVIRYCSTYDDNKSLLKQGQNTDKITEIYLNMRKE